MCTFPEVCKNESNLNLAEKRRQDKAKKFNIHIPIELKDPLHRSSGQQKKRKQ